METSRDRLINKRFFYQERAGGDGRLAPDLSFRFLVDLDDGTEGDRGRLVAAEVCQRVGQASRGFGMEEMLKAEKLEVFRPEVGFFVLPAKSFLSSATCIRMHSTTQFSILVFPKAVPAMDQATSQILPEISR